jgi:hypothetical protein
MLYRPARQKTAALLRFLSNLAAWKTSKMDPNSANSPNPYASPGVTPNNSPSVSRNNPKEPLTETIHGFGSVSRQDIKLTQKLVLQNWYYTSARLAGGWISLLIFILFISMYQKMPFVFFVATSFVMIAPCLPFLIAHVMRRAREANSQIGIFGFREFFILEDGYETRSECTYSKTKWTAFRGYRYSDQMVLLVFQNSYGQGISFPRSLFQTQHDWECFLGLLDRKLTRC